MDARHHLAVGLDRFLQRAAAVDVRDGGAGLGRIDVLLRAGRDVLLRRAEVVVRVGGARVAGHRDDQFFHDVPQLYLFDLSALARPYHGVEHRHAVQHLVDRRPGRAFLPRCSRANSTSSALSMSNAGALDDLVRRRGDRSGRRHGRDRHEAEARQVRPGEFRQALAAEQREAQRGRGRDRAEQQPGRAALEAQHDVGGVVRRARRCSGRWCTSTSRTRPPNSIMWSMECTPTAVMRAARRLVGLRPPVVGRR